MSLYCFDLHDRNGHPIEAVAVELPSFKAVAREASRLLVDVARDEMQERDQIDLSLEVRDEFGKPVYSGRLTFRSQWERD